MNCEDLEYQLCVILHLDACHDQWAKFSFIYTYVYILMFAYYISINVKK